MNRTFTLLCFFIVIALSGCGFAGTDSAETPGFLMGVWHGLLAPWTLIVRFFIDDIQMYAMPNSGIGYDFGFLLGVGGSLPVGWIVVLIALVYYFMPVM